MNDELLNLFSLIENGDPDDRIAEDSLSAFTRQAWHVIEPGTEYIHGWHIDAISEHLEAVSSGQIRNLIINIPPRHMKSISVCVMWPAWTWIHRPQARWMFASYSSTYSTRDSLKCRNVIRSSWYQQRWGHAYQLTDDQNEKKRFENTERGFRQATSVTASATGEGADYVIADDPHKAIEIYSKAKRDSVQTWWKETMSTRLNNPETGGRVVIMQRLHEEDLTGYLIEQMQVDGTHYEHLCLPAEYEPDRRCHTVLGNPDPRSKAGALIWPERFNRRHVLALKKDLGLASSGQLQQRPSPAGGNIVKNHWFRFWYPTGTQAPPPYQFTVEDEDGTSYVHDCVQMELPQSFDLQGLSWDMAFKDKKTSDYVAGGSWGKRKADYFLLDQIRERLNLPNTIDRLMNQIESYPLATLKLIEDKANGPAVIQTIQKRVAGVEPYTPDRNKEARLNAAAPIIKSGNVYLPHPQLFPWVQTFIDEVTNFPNAKHDDQVDQMTQFILYVESMPKPKPKPPKSAVGNKRMFAASSGNQSSMPKMPSERNVRK